MTRNTVFMLAAETSLEVRTQPLAPDARMADEVFSSTTGGGIIPIMRVDGQAIATGQPSPVTRRLDDLYWSKRRAAAVRAAPNGFDSYRWCQSRAARRSYRADIASAISGSM